ncbi:MAG: AAA family ATPase [Candidatus Micrarchaeia archaeon]
MKLVLTGTPGTGKTTLAAKLARALDCALLDANALAKANKLVKRDGETDVKKLESILKKKIAKLDSFVAEGHLLCEFPLECDVCVVLRCNPKTLAKRLAKRGYAKRKTSDNVLCEALDYCLVNAERGYRRVVQLDNTHSLSCARFLAKTKAGGDKIAWPLAECVPRTKTRGKV